MEQKAKKDFSKGKIYMIRCNKTQLIYIGSTTKQYLSQRMGKHKSHYRDWTNDKGKYISSFEIIKNGDYVILLVELYPCKSNDELRMREQYHIDLNGGCLNKNRAYTTTEQRLKYEKEYYQANKETISEQHKKYHEANKEEITEYQKEYRETNKEAIAEYDKEYREANKEAIAERTKEWREANKEAISERKKEKITCTCGAVINKYKKSRHIKTNKHKTLIDGQ